MGTVFGPHYAAAYDALYRDKDYAAECDLLERAFREYGQARIARVLDLGCGTGGHAMLLAERGYDVLGVDRSEQMLERARARRSAARFVQGDATALNLDERFDAVLMMFAVLGYQVGNADVQSALKTVRRHLERGGLFIADVWYGPSVLSQRPGDRVRVIELPTQERIIRAASAEMDTRLHVCSVEYQVWRLGNGRVLDEAREEHRMRFFFPLELELLLNAAGFDLVRLGAFPNLEAEPDESTWNAAIVARAT